MARVLNSQPFRAAVFLSQGTVFRWTPVHCTSVNTSKCPPNAWHHTYAHLQVVL